MKIHLRALLTIITLLCSAQCFAQAPSLSYASPRIYTIGVPVSQAPTSSGVAPAAYGATRVFPTSGLLLANGLAVDAAGNIFVGDLIYQAIREIPAGSSTAFTFASGFSNPYGVAVDKNGNVYVADSDNMLVKKIAPGGSAITIIGSGFHRPGAVAVDQKGNVYVADTFHNLVKKIPFDNSTAPVVIGTGFNGPTGIAVDSTGNVYVADWGNSAVKEIKASDGSTITIGSGFNHPAGVAIDPSGNIFVADYYNGVTKEILVNSGTIITVETVAAYPTGVALSATGVLYVIDTSGNPLKEVSPIGGYYLSAPLPAGLSFSNTTGIISGTPTALSPPTNYTVTAWNANGSTSTTVNIAVNALSSDPTNALLTKIATNSGVVLNQVNGPDYKDYAITVPTTLRSITVTPTSQDPAAMVKVNGVDVASGSASAAISLSDGANVINTAVTAPDGVTTKTYSITVTRLPGPLLSSITTNSGASLITVSGPDHRDFTCTVTSATTSITVTAVSSDPSYTIKINGVPVASGSPSAAISLPYGVTTINTVLTAPDGASNTYSIAVTRPLSNNASLTKLITNSGVPLTQVSGPDYKDYAITVPATLYGITITPTAQDATATIKVNGVSVVSGAASANIPLSTGVNTVTIVVTAQDGVTTKTYAIAVTWASNDALLSSIKTTPAETLTSVSGSSHRNYTTQVNNNVSSIQINATAQDNGAKITINGAAVASGALSPAIPLAIGANVINTVVTSSDGTTSNTYTITVNRISNNALLTKLNTNTGVALTQVTGTDYRDYTLSLPNSTSSMTVTPITQDATATITLSGVAVASGTPSAAIPLQVGANTIITVVTAQDGTTIKTYGITVTRAAMMALYAPKDSVAADGLTVHPGITPNGDGINDIFTIDGINAFPDNKVTIMGRSGAVIYEAKGYDNQSKFFDGHSNKNGSLQLPGTYFYSLEYVADGKTKVKTGFIVLKY